MTNPIEIVSPAFFSTKDIILDVNSGQIDGGGSLTCTLGPIVYTAKWPSSDCVSEMIKTYGSDNGKVLSVKWGCGKNCVIRTFYLSWDFGFKPISSISSLLLLKMDLCLRDVADGLAYLHNHKFVHGDIKALNVLISQTDRAMLCDFGLSKAIDGTSSSGGADGSVRWQSPERLGNGYRSIKDDVYAYGITIYETLSGQVPFMGLGNSQVTTAVVVRQSRPPKEPATSATGKSYEVIWTIAERCWVTSPRDRPSMKEVMNWLSPKLGTGALMLASIAAEVGSSNDGTTDKPIRLMEPQPVGHLDLTRKRSLGQIVNAMGDVSQKRYRSQIGTQGLDEEAISRDKFNLIKGLPRAKHASYDSQRSNEPSACLEGTRREVLTKIRNWIANTDARAEPVFLLTGMAGTGKTTIAYTIALQSDEEDILGGTYFFSAQGEEDLRGIDKVISSLAFQLARLDPEYKRNLAHALDEDPDFASKTRQKQMQGLVIGPLKRISRTAPIVLVLDALDECGERASVEILQLILSAAEKITVSLRILLTSRPEPHILSLFRRHDRHRALILHDIEEAIIQSDIKLFFTSQLAPSRFHPPLSSSCMTSQQLELLVEYSGKLFIYAVMAVRFIRDNRVHAPQKQVELLLTKSTSPGTPGALADLDRLYLQLLETAASTRSPQLSFEQIRDVLGPIVLLRDPLSLEGLEALLAATPGHVRAALYPLQSVVITPEFDDGIARTFHQSFPDFITDPLRCHDRRFSINVAEHEKRLVIRCLQIMLEGLHYNMANIDDPMEPKANIQDLTERIQPEMSYACRFWVQHLRAVSPGDPDVVSLLDIFASRCILWWIEVCSVLKSINSAISSSSAAREWAQNSYCSQDTTDVLNDTYRFLLANGSLINTYPLHTYLSALPFVPQSTTLFRMYDSKGIPSVKILCGREESWPMSLAVWAGHDRNVTSVKFSPDGSRVVSGSEDNTVRIWDAVSGDVVAALEGHEDTVTSVGFSPEGSRVVSGSKDQTARIWDTFSGDVVVKLQGHTGTVNAVVFSPNGSQVVSGSEDKTVRIWDAVSGDTVAVLQGHDDTVTFVAFSPDGPRVVAPCQDRATSKDVLVRLEARVGRLSMIFSPDESRIISYSWGQPVWMWYARAGSNVVKLEGHDDEVTSAAFSPDGCRVVSGSRDNTVRIWDASSGHIVIKLEGHVGTVNSVSFSPDGSRVVSGSRDQTVRIWDAVSADVITPRRGGDKVTSVVFSVDGIRILSVSEGKAFRIWSTSGNIIIEVKGNFNSVVFSPDGSRVVARSEDSIQIWDSLLGQVVAMLKSAIFSPDGSLVVSSTYNSKAQIWDVASGDVEAELPFRGTLISMAFSPDRSRGVTSSKDCIVCIWDLMSGDQIFLKGHEDAVTSLAFSTDGSKVVSGGKDKTIAIWDAISGESLVKREGHDDTVTSLAFSPDGSRVVSGSRDMTVRIWDPFGGNAPIKLEDHVGTVNSVAFSPDGTLVVSSTYNKTVRIWDVASRRVLASFKDHVDPANSVALSLDPSDPLLAGETFDDWFTRQQTRRLQDGSVRPMFAINRQWLMWENRPDGQVRLCKLPSRFTSDGIPMAVHNSTIALGNDDGVVTVLDVSTALSGLDVS